MTLPERNLQTKCLAEKLIFWNIWNIDRQQVGLMVFDCLKYFDIFSVTQNCESETLYCIVFKHTGCAVV